VPFRSLWAAMQHDKKVVVGQVVGVWPVRIGAVVIRPVERRACEAWYSSRHGRTESTTSQSRTGDRRPRIRSRRRR
jgi:3-dehydroquinate synthase